MRIFNPESPIYSSTSPGAAYFHATSTWLQGHFSSQLTQFRATPFDTEDMSQGPHDRKGVHPHGYLVYLAYDNHFNLVPSNSGALRVENPNDLHQLLTQELTIQKDGFLHVYVSNGSSEKGINYDNFLITAAKGKTRQINHYYPYGLRISGMDGYTHDYKNMYTSKELQTGEFDPSISTGLEMYDFHARFYDPQLGRWFAPDPAEQFSNPYLAMGNNPVGYIDPDGRFVFFMPHVNAGRGSFDIGFTIGVGIPGLKSAQLTLGHTFQQGGPDNSYASLSGTLGGVTGYVGYGTQTGTTAGVGFGFGPYMGGFNTNLTSVGVNWSQNYGVSANAFGATIGNGHIGFNPSVGYSYGWGWETGRGDESPFNDNNLIASNDPKFIAFGPTYEHVGLLKPSQRFQQWQQNRAAWGNNWYYIQYGRPQIIPPLPIDVQVGIQITAGAQVGLGARLGISPVNPKVNMNFTSVELFDGYINSDGPGLNIIGHGGNYRIHRELDLFGFGGFESFYTTMSGDYSNHMYGGNFGPVSLSNRGPAVNFEGNFSFLVGIRLYGSVSFK